MKLKMKVARAYKSPYEAEPTPCTLLCVSARYTPEAGLYVECGDIKDGVFYPNKGGEWMYEAFMDLLDCTREPKASETREKFRLLIGGDGDPMAQLKPIRIELNVAGAKEGRCVVLPCKIFDKIWNVAAHYQFEVTEIDLLPYGNILFRCGNKGTDDYAAFYGDDLGDTFTFEEPKERDNCVVKEAALRREQDG